MAAPLKTQRNYVIEVRGYSPGQGHAAITNSQKMADSVVRYLVLNQQIPIHRIYMVGMGNGPADDRGKTCQAHHRGTGRNHRSEERSGEFRTTLIPGNNG